MNGACVDLEAIRQAHKDEWVLVEVVEEDWLKRPVRGRLLAHSPQREELYRKLTSTKAKDPLVFFTGEIPSKDYVAIF